MKRMLALVAGLVLAASGCDSGDDNRRSGCKKSPTPKAISQVLIKPGPGGGGRPGGGGAKGGGAKPVKPKTGNKAPKNGTNGGVQPTGCR